MPRFFRWLVIVVLVVAVYLGLKVALAKFNFWRFGQDVDDISRDAVFQGRDVTLVQQDIFKDAFKMGLPLTLEQVHVEQAGSGLAVHAKYSVPVDLAIPGREAPIHFTTLRFNLDSEHTRLGQ